MLLKNTYKDNYVKLNTRRGTCFGKDAAEKFYSRDGLSNNRFSTAVVLEFVITTL